MWRHRGLRRAAASVLLISFVAGCGGDDDADTTPAAGVSTTTTTRAGGGAAPTTASGASGSPTTTGAGGAATGKLPDACGLIDDAAAGAAMAGTVASKAANQPPTDVATTCMWAGGGIYSMSLIVRRGTSAKTSFDNTVSSGFAATTLAGSDARVNLGAPEAARDYRLVSYAAYNGTHFVYLTIQGRNRADVAATEIAAGLVRTVLTKL